MYWYISFGWFVLGLVSGAAIGFFTAALLSVAHDK